MASFILELLESFQIDFKTIFKVIREHLNESNAWAFEVKQTNLDRAPWLRFHQACITNILKCLDLTTNALHKHRFDEGIRLSFSSQTYP